MQTLHVRSHSEWHLMMQIEAWVSLILRTRTWKWIYQHSTEFHYYLPT